MIYNLCIVITYILEMSIGFLFFSQQGERKYDKFHTFLIGGLIFLFGAFVDIFFNNIVWLNGLSFALINFLFGFLAFKISWKKALFYGVVLDILSTAFEFITINFVSIVTGTDVTTYVSELSFFILIVSISKIFYLIFCVILASFTSKKEIRTKYPLAFFIYPFAVIGTLLLFWAICAKYEIDEIYLHLISALCFILFISIVLLFVSFQYYVKKENRIRDLQNQIDKIEHEKNYYDILSKQNENLMIYAHDTKNHLTAIRELNNNPEIEEYLNKMTDTLKTYSNIGHCGNKMLDIILNRYQSECEIQGIKFIMDLHNVNFSYMDDFELVSVFDNILDNAVEASLKTENKKIELHTNYQNSFDVLTLTNSCDKKPDFNENGFVTSKKNKEFHGYGTKSVQKILKKYNGQSQWEYNNEDKEFSLTIIIPNSLDKKN